MSILRIELLLILSFFSLIQNFGSLTPVSIIWTSYDPLPRLCKTFTLASEVDNGELFLDDEDVDDEFELLVLILELDITVEDTAVSEELILISELEFWLVVEDATVTIELLAWFVANSDLMDGNFLVND